jgi:hypothetical protein
VKLNDTTSLALCAITDASLYLCRVCLISELYYACLSSLSLYLASARACLEVRGGESPKTSQVSISASEKALASARRTAPRPPAGPGSSGPAGCGSRGGGIIAVYVRGREHTTRTYTGRS